MFQHRGLSFIAMTINLDSKEVGAKPPLMGQ
jgi:hypothetical protein